MAEEDYNPSGATGSVEEVAAAASIHENDAVAAPHPCIATFWATRGPRFVELLAVGGSQPRGYGFIRGGGPYGRIGLDQDEFFESIQMISYVSGMIAALGGRDSVADLWLTQQIDHEITRVSGIANAEAEQYADLPKSDAA